MEGGDPNAAFKASQMHQQSASQGAAAGGFSPDNIQQFLVEAGLPAQAVAEVVDKLFKNDSNNLQALLNEQLDKYFGSLNGCTLAQEQKHINLEVPKGLHEGVTSAGLVGSQGH